MTAVLDSSTDNRPVEPAARLASWPARAGALAVDVLPGLGAVASLLPWILAGPRIGWPWWVCTVAAAVVTVAVLVNRWLLPTLTGWSLGRALLGVRVVRSRDGAAAGLGRLVLRDLAHLLDTGAVFIGWLWPLWDRRNRTFADLLARTEVHQLERPRAAGRRDPRRWTVVVLVATVLLSVAGAVFGYLTVYRPQQQTDAARAEIAEQGPRIVEQMLSYQADTIDEDFTRARSLTTERYREQLAAEQQAVKLTEPTTNDYWAVSSAVLSNTRDEAAMLLAMQGQRGATPEELKFITATVRVEFKKSPEGQWQVDGLTVLKRPYLGEDQP
ncbi:RDD family protein [Mycolicibacterium thermoresistibile]